MCKIQTSQIRDLEAAKLQLTTGRWWRGNFLPPYFSKISLSDTKFETIRRFLGTCGSNFECGLGQITSEYASK